MEERGDARTDEQPPPRERLTIDRLLLAGLGWASMTAEAADELADDLSRRVGVDRDEMRSAVRDSVAGWRREASSVGDRRGEALDRALARLGLARREEVDDLALRVAQLEHRIRLVERDTHQHD